MKDLDFSLSNNKFKPIEIIEKISESNNWNYQRVLNNKINIVAQGVWHNYSLEINYSEKNDILDLYCFFDLSICIKKQLNFLKLLNIVNRENLNGTFIYFFETNILIFKKKLSEISDNDNFKRDISDTINKIIFICDRFYPAFQIVSWTNELPENAINLAFDSTMGSA
tara:strand:- start:321 stop:824 length:504 start_codon:yes stop_codon:yes gene_type:complete